MWSPLDKQSLRSSPGPWLEMQEARLLSQPWQCQLYQGERLLGTAVYLTELPGTGWSETPQHCSPSPDQSHQSCFQNPSLSPPSSFLSNQGSDLQLLSTPDPILLLIS